MRITRIDNIAWKQTHSLDLARGEDVVDLTRDTVERNPMDLNQITHAASMVAYFRRQKVVRLPRANNFLIDSSNLSLLETFKVELPCRLLHVWGGLPSKESHVVYGSPSSCILLYVIGSSYMGDGTRAKSDFVTRLYKLGIPE